MRVVDRSNPRIFSAPNGRRVTIYKDEYIQFPEDMNEDAKYMISEIAQLSYDNLPEEKKTAIDAFLQMGWKEV